MTKKAQRLVPQGFEQDIFFLKNLVVGIGEVSEITKIPTRKIRYWEEKGIITSLTEGKVRIEGMIIKT